MVQPHFLRTVKILLVDMDLPLVAVSPCITKRMLLR